MLSFLVFMGYTTVANAWSFTGHVLIAQIAYDNLIPAVKQKAKALADIMFNQLPNVEQEKLNQKYASASTFAKIAMLPDVWRKWKVKTIFNKFDAPLPTNLISDANQSTQPWHYIAAAYPANNNCSTIQPYNVVWAINTLKTDLSNTRNPQAEAVLMTLEEHYVGDVNQPLHTFTNVNHECQSDKGGNDFCLRMNKKDRCTKSLHSLWDNGVGFIKPKMNIAAAAYQLEQRYPKTEFALQLNDNNPMDWAKRSYGDAGFIDSLAQGEKPTPTYYRRGQQLATTQLALAGYQLAALLNQTL